MSITPARSRFRQVADLIRQRIEAGEYPKGSALPKEDVLASELGVNRGTVNDALKVLEAEGHVRAIRGRGTFVNELPPILRDAQARYSTAAREQGRGAFDVEVRALGREPRIDLRVERVTPPAAVAQILGLEADTPALARIRRMGADDVPLQIATSYIPLDIAEGTVLEQVDTGPGGIISRFAELGHKQVEVSEETVVRPPKPDEIEFLGMTEDQRVYEITHVGWTAEGRAVEVCVHIMPTHQWTLRYRWPLQ